MLQALDGGGGVVAHPSSQPQTHVVGGSDTLNGIADRYGVTPAALREANPQIFQDPTARRRDDAMNGGDMLWTGDRLNIPPAAESVVRNDPLGSDFNPTYPSPNSEYTVGGEGERGGGAITWNPGDGSLKLTGIA